MAALAKASGSALALITELHTRSEHMPLEITQRPTATASAVGPLRRPPIQWLPYLLLLPSLAVICLIELYPFLTGVSYSFHKGTLLGTGAFVGLQNYERLFGSSDFYHSLWFSFIFALFNVLFSYLIGLALALFLNLDFPGRGFCRVFLLLPWIAGRSVNRQLEMVDRGSRGARQHHLK